MSLCGGICLYKRKNFHIIALYNIDMFSLGHAARYIDLSGFNWIINICISISFHLCLLHIYLLFPQYPLKDRVHMSQLNLSDASFTGK